MRVVVAGVDRRRQRAHGRARRAARLAQESRDRLAGDQLGQAQRGEREQVGGETAARAARRRPRRARAARAAHPTVAARATGRSMAPERLAQREHARPRPRRRRPGGGTALAASAGVLRRVARDVALLQAERVAHEIGQAERAPRTGRSQRLTMSHNAASTRLGVPAAASRRASSSSVLSVDSTRPVLAAALGHAAARGRRGRSARPPSAARASARFPRRPSARPAFARSAWRAATAVLESRGRLIGLLPRSSPGSTTRNSSPPKRPMPS